MHDILKFATLKDASSPTLFAQHTRTPRHHVLETPTLLPETHSMTAKYERKELKSLRFSAIITGDF